jgi:hypothetical protein
MVPIHTDFQNLSKKNLDRKRTGKSLTKSSSFFRQVHKIAKIAESDYWPRYVCLFVRTDCASSWLKIEGPVNRVLIIRPTQPDRSSILTFYCALQHVSPVQFSHHKVGAGYTKRCEGRQKKCKRKGPVILYLCVRHLPDDGWTGQPKHTVVYNKRHPKFMWLCLVG